MPHLAEGRVSKQINWNSSTWDIGLFSSKVNINHLSISVWIHGYLLYTLGFNLILFFTSILPSGSQNNPKQALCKEIMKVSGVVCNAC